MSGQNGVRDYLRVKGDQFEVGDRVVVSGGYDYEPAWLRGGDGYVGTLIELADSVGVVEVDEEITLKWTNPTGRLNVGLCSERPRPTAIPPGGGIGCWVESHATMRAAD
jgi:hypothetical protein